MTAINDNWTRRCLIVPSSHIVLAKSLCEGITPGDSGKGMFAVPISSTGSTPATNKPVM